MDGAKVTDFETKTLMVNSPGSRFASYLIIDMCTTCGIPVLDKELHHLSHVWENMTIGAKIAYAKRKRAAGEDNVYSDSIVRRDL